MFLLKKIVSRLLFPIPLSLLLGFVGLVLPWFTRRIKAGKALTTSGLVLLLLLSSAPVADSLLAPLEERYPPYGMPGLEGLGRGLTEDEIAYVVILAGGRPMVDDVPVTAQMSAHSMARLIEGVRVHRRCVNSKLILSGGLGVPSDARPETLTNHRFAVLFGVDPDDIIIESRSSDTKDQARLVAEIVGDVPMVLVTSASHMPRSMALFRKAGMQPIPAPTDYLIQPGSLRVLSLVPSAGELYKSERAIYEYLGLIWARLRGQI